MPMRRTLGAIILLMVYGSANSALVSRLAGQAYYDTVQNITWLTNANLADTNSFGVPGIAASGAMDWNEAQSWIGAMNAAHYLGTSDWRLPVVIDTGAPGCQQAYSGTDCGYNVDVSTSEMAHLFHITLGNQSTLLPNESPSGCGNACLTNVGPFANMLNNGYWSGTTYAPNALEAWYYYYGWGYSDWQGKNDNKFLMPVRDGDIDADEDDIAENLDNCTLVANPTQCDSDVDGYGNRCDGDMNNSGSTNAQDTTLYRQQLGQPSVAPIYNKADINCNGVVNAQDTTLFRQLLGSPPGPSGLVP